MNNFQDVFYSIINILSLFVINLRRYFLRKILLIIAICISTFILIIAFNFTANINNLLYELIFKKIPVNEIYIQHNITINNDGSKSMSFITKELIENLTSWDELISLEPISKTTFPTLTKVKSKGLFFSMPILGIPEEFAKRYIDRTVPTFKDYQEEFPNGFKVHNNKIPLLIPHIGHSLVKNFFQVNSIELKEPINMLKIFNYSILFNQSMIQKKNSSEIYEVSNIVPVGFLKSHVSMIGFFVPLSILEKAKNHILKTKSKGYELALIRIKPDIDVNKFKLKLSSFLSKHNIKVSKDSLFSQIGNYARNSLNLFNLTISFLMALILIMISSTIFYGFSFFFEKRSYEIKIYKILGATKNQIFALFMLESFTITLLAIPISFLFGFLFIENFMSSNLYSFASKYANQEAYKNSTIINILRENKIQFQMVNSILLGLFIFIFSNIISFLSLVKSTFGKKFND